jgi:hypothetical protein
MVYKKVNLTGSSTESWEDAAMQAVERAETTLENVKWVEVQGRGIELASVDEPEYQTEVEIAFELEGGQNGQ